MSAHFVIRRDGRSLQFVSCDERAWHAGLSSWRGRANCNDYSIGIELEGLEGERFEAAQYECLATVIERLAERYPVAAVVGHEHVAPGRKHDPGEQASIGRGCAGWPPPGSNSGLDPARLAVAREALAGSLETVKNPQVNTL